MQPIKIIIEKLNQTDTNKWGWLTDMSDEDMRDINKLFADDLIEEKPKIINGVLVWRWRLKKSKNEEAYFKIAEQQRGEALKDIKKSINEWRRSPEMQEIARKARIRYYQGRLEVLQEMLSDNVKRYQEARNDLEVYGWSLPIIAAQAKRLNAEIVKCRRGIEALRSRRPDQITPEMVERAREYPIKDLLEVGPNGRAKCCFHNGEHYNMDIRKNFAYCHVCNAHGDAIDVYRSIHGVGFREAVMALAG